MGYQYGVRYRPMRHVPTSTISGPIGRLLLRVRRTLWLGGQGVNRKAAKKCRQMWVNLFICCAIAAFWRAMPVIKEGTPEGLDGFWPACCRRFRRIRAQKKEHK